MSFFGGRSVYPHQEDEIRAFAEKAAAYFAQDADAVTFGDMTPGSFFARRWGLDQDCVIVLKLDEDFQPVNYMGIIRPAEAQS